MRWSHHGRGLVNYLIDNHGGSLRYGVGSPQRGGDLASRLQIQDGALDIHQDAAGSRSVWTASKLQNAERAPW